MLPNFRSGVWRPVQLSKGVAYMRKCANVLPLDTRVLSRKRASQGEQSFILRSYVRVLLATLITSKEGESLIVGASVTPLSHGDCGGGAVATIAAQGIKESTAFSVAVLVSSSTISLINQQHLASVACVTRTVGIYRSPCIIWG